MSMVDNDELRARIRDLEDENTALRRVLDTTTHEKTEIECLCLRYRAMLVDAGIEVD